MERVKLVEEALGKKTPYDNIGCGSCNDKITKLLNNIIVQNKNLIAEWDKK